MYKEMISLSKISRSFAQGFFSLEGDVHDLKTSPGQKEATKFG